MNYSCTQRGKIWRFLVLQCSQTYTCATNLVDRKLVISAPDSGADFVTDGSLCQLGTRLMNTLLYPIQNGGPIQCVRIVGCNATAASILIISSR